MTKKSRLSGSSRSGRLRRSRRSNRAVVPTNVSSPEEVLCAESQLQPFEESFSATEARVSSGQVTSSDDDPLCTSAPSVSQNPRQDPQQSAQQNPQQDSQSSSQQNPQQDSQSSSKQNTQQQTAPIRKTQSSQTSSGSDSVRRDFDQTFCNNKWIEESFAPPEPKQVDYSHNWLLRLPEQLLCAVVFSGFFVGVLLFFFVSDLMDVHYLPLEEVSTGESFFVLDINNADWADFTALEGIGQEKARVIVAHRKMIGGFREVNDMRYVEGIGPKTWAVIKPHLYCQQEEQSVEQLGGKKENLAGGVTTDTMDGETYTDF